VRKKPTKPKLIGLKMTPPTVKPGYTLIEIAHSQLEIRLLVQAKALLEKAQSETLTKP